MALTRRSSVDFRQRYVLGTSIGRRLSFRKYSSTIAGGIAARIVHCHQESMLRKSGIYLAISDGG
jgi:hypothetical protein